MLQIIVLTHFFGNSQVYSFTNNFTIFYNRDSSSYHVRFMLLLVLSHLCTEWYEICLLFYEPLDGVILVSQSCGKIKMFLKWLSSFYRFTPLLATLTCFFKASLLFIFFGEINCFFAFNQLCISLSKSIYFIVSVSRGSIKKRGTKIFFTYKIERRDCSSSAGRL